MQKLHGRGFFKKHWKKIIAAGLGASCIGAVTYAVGDTSGHHANPKTGGHDVLHFESGSGGDQIDASQTFAHADVKGEYATAPIDTLKMCSLSYYRPYYDCPPEFDGKNDESGKMWTIYIFDGDAWMNCLRYKSSSCATWPSDIIYYEITDKQWRDSQGRGLLEHELEHLKCQCDWHGIGNS